MCFSLYFLKEGFVFVRDFEGMRRSRDKKKKEKGESLVVKMAFSAAKSIGGKARVRNTIKEQRQQIRKLSNAEIIK
jgi:hypothetical protein